MPRLQASASILRGRGRGRLIASAGTPFVFANEGSERVTIDSQGRVRIAADQVSALALAGRQIAAIEVPQRPTCMIFAGPDRKTLFITARPCLYGIRTC